MSTVEPGKPMYQRPAYGQNFLNDPNLLDAIVRSAEVEPGNVVLEVGGGTGALTAVLAPQVELVHVVEIDERLRPGLEALAVDHPNVRLHWGDAMKLDLAGLDPVPVAMVANLPYAVATPVLMRTLSDLPELQRWTVMVQLEIAQRLRADPGNKLYGSPSALAQICCEVKMIRKVGRAVFNPRPRVDSAVLQMTRTGPAPPQEVRELIRACFAHRRKALPRSIEMAARSRDGGGDSREALPIDPAELRTRARTALESAGLAIDSRAEALSPTQLRDLAEAVLAG